MKQDFCLYIAKVNYIYREVENLDHRKSSTLEIFLLTLFLKMTEIYPLLLTNIWDNKLTIQ